MRRVRSSVLQSVFRLGFVVRGRGVAGGAAVARRFRGVRAPFFSSLVVLAVSVLAVAAPSASASKGIYDVFGSGPGALGGEFGFSSSQGVAAVAVNSSGAGGAGVGDVYVADRRNNRVQRFDADGTFVSAWGQDVDTAGGTGFEVCTVAANCKIGATGGTGGAMNDPRGIAVDQASGDVYVADSSNFRIQQFSATGGFIRAFGRDVVSSGVGNAPAASEVQSLTVPGAVTAGSYTLSFQGQTTAPIAYNETAANVQAALRGLSSIGGTNVNVTGTGPLTITFAANLANNPEPLITVDSTGLTGGTATVSRTTAGSNGFEICESAVTCKTGVAGVTAGALFASPALLQQGSLAVAPQGAPNAGNVLAADAASRRVQEFSASGAFVRAFGWDVVAAGQGNTGIEFEVCRASAFDACKIGLQGTGIGQFGGTGGAISSSAAPNRIAEDAGGNIYTVESGSNFRVQRFTLSALDAVSPQGTFDPADLTGTSASNTPIDVAIDGAGHVFALMRLSSSETRFLEIDPAANGGTGGVIATLGSIGQVPTGLAANLATGRLYVTAPPGSVYIVDEVPDIGVSDLEATDVGASTATLRATIAPSQIPLATSYRFEYARVGTEGWLRAPLSDADIGNGSGGPGDPAGCPTGNPSVCEVSQDISGLDFEVAYKFRVVARTQFGGTVTTVDGPEFDTVATGPVVRTGSALWSSPADTAPSLLFAGTINPGRDRTSYRFEYVTEDAFAESGFGFAASAPAVAAEAGNGVTTVAVTQNVVGLDPSQAYRYRLVATNSVDTTVGGVRVVEPPSPDDRFYERVSDGDSWGAGVGPVVGSVAASGDRARFSALAFGQPDSLPGPSSPFVAERGDSGWEVASMGPDVDHANERALGGVGSLASADLGVALWPQSSLSERERGEVRFSYTHIDGTRTPASPLLTPLNQPERRNSLYDLQAATPDLSSFAFVPQTEVGTPAVAFFADEPILPNPSTNLYQVTGAGTVDSKLHIVNRADGADGSVIGGVCGADLGDSLDNDSVRGRALSVDGSVVYFTVRPAEPTTGSCFNSTPARVFKRVDNEATVNVSASQCTRTVPVPCSSADGDDRYMGASADGSVAFFASPRQLTDSDLDSGSPTSCPMPGQPDGPDALGCDLYLYDASPPAGQPNLVQVSAGETVAGDHPTVGAGAAVRGVVASSADGSRVYFVAEGRLTDDATQGAKNLYVYQRDDDHPTGRIAFVGALAPGLSEPNGAGGDGQQWRTGVDGRKAAFALPADGVEGDGHFLLFLSNSQLVGDDDDSSKDLYRYDDETDEMLCLSCAGDEERNVDISRDEVLQSVGDSVPIATDDVSAVVFSTPEALSPDDTNTGAQNQISCNSYAAVGCDVYVWRDGEVDLVTGGTGEFGINAGTQHNSALSPDGESVFFMTRAPLVASDVNNANDLYVARIGGGFPAGAPAAACALLDGGCQSGGVTPISPDVKTAPSADGNVVSERRTLAVRGPGSKARRRAARTGVLAFGVRASGPGVVRIVARARFGGKAVKVADVRRRVRTDTTRVKLRLSRRARRALAEGRVLRVVLVVEQPGARQRTLTIGLERGRS